ncbi:proteobacterial dedicated sortase system histidine kinase [Pseudomaricurvus alkylphenolicus]|jgi:dedicated sortase system histidine kinase|uniref:ATP-binding protein n=1 Tax=Pseudomaricurvus alkylphenolicus TaxID=1306991 RepID=UPI00141E9968|nr:ATP-binding protein [Pseudomaricurvus alkylphenolicus]NIB42895.1 proteobacterial dedicated sortase system histidine kinase [Pseudomaricurvus alkylphenolicus]
MKLRRQLLLVSLLTLSLPWAGCQYIQEMESALRQGQVEALRATAKAVADRVSSEADFVQRLQQPDWQQPFERQLYLHPINTPMQIDGYDDDWRHSRIRPRRFRDLVDNSLEMELRLARQAQQVLLFVRVTDPNIRYHNPSISPLASGDHLLLRGMEPGGRVQDYVLRAGAPGEIQARYRDSSGRVREEPRIRGYWQEHQQGYQLELQMPLTMMEAGLSVAVVDRREGGGSRWLGTVHGQERPAPLAGLEAPLQRAVEVFSDEGLRLQLLSRNGWQVAKAGDLQPPYRVVQQHGLLSWIYLRVLADNYLPPAAEPAINGRSGSPQVLEAQQGQAASGWYQWRDLRLAQVALPIRGRNKEVIAVVLAEQTSAQLLALTNSAFNRLFHFTLLATLITGMGLLAYASWLSFRIRRLSKAADQALLEGGRLQVEFPHSKSADELGDLNRSYATLLERLREYTDYLRSLSSKLSHELRTPLAVVRSSLDNLEHEALSESARTYAERAQQGSQRLSSIITAMSSASRVEESIRHAETETFELAPVIESLGQAYTDLHQHVCLQVEVDDLARGRKLQGSVELVVQMLDKLVDNGADFCPSGGLLKITLLAGQRGLLLTVANDGPPLPEKMQGQLFDSLVSVREPGGETTHLGLGLHIVRLIVEFHGGTVTARNRPDSGVEFEVSFPCPDVPL